MKNIFYIAFFSLLFSACSPSVDLDEGQWEQVAKITEFVIYKQSHQDVTLPNGEVLDGVIKLDLAKAADFDVENKQVSITIPSSVKNEELAKAGCYMTHNGKKVIPLENSPKPGTILDWNNVSQCKYRIETANKKYSADWTINIYRE